MDPVTDPVATIRELGVVPVLVLDSVEDAEPVAQALALGGLPIAEVTFRTEAAVGTIERIVQTVPDFLVGAGTVLSVEDAEAAVTAGARFVVTPGLDPAVVGWCQRRDIPVVPGVMTPSEVGVALGFGITLLKFFPAEPAGGVRMLQALGGPFPTTDFLPTGGIDESNLAEYLRLPMVAACGASWVVDRELIRTRDFATVTARTATFVDIAREARHDR